VWEVPGANEATEVFRQKRSRPSAAGTLIADVEADWFT
jgi:hypothetical protein